MHVDGGGLTTSLKNDVGLLIDVSQSQGIILPRGSHASTTMCHRVSPFFDNKTTRKIKENKNKII